MRLALLVGADMRGKLNLEKRTNTLVVLWQVNNNLCTSLGYLEIMLVIIICMIYFLFLKIRLKCETHTVGFNICAFHRDAFHG